MSYTKLKKQRSDAQKALKEAKQELDQLESKIDNLHEQFEASYSDLTDARACLKVGEGSAKDVSKAEKVNRDTKDKLEMAKTNIDVQKKAVSLLKDKFDVVDEEFKKQASAHFNEQSQPLFKTLTDAIQQAESAIQSINELARNAEREGVTIQTKGINRQSEILISKQRPAGTLALSTINLNQLQK